MFSIAIIYGIITKLNEIKLLENGDRLINLVLASELSDNKHSVIFHDVVLWNQTADKFTHKKGDQVSIMGELKYKIKDGHKYSEIIGKYIK